jgi:hypothetical protein
MAQELDLEICTITSWTHGAVRELFGIPVHLRPGRHRGHRLSQKQAEDRVKGSQYIPEIHHNEYDVPRQSRTEPMKYPLSSAMFATVTKICHRSIDDARRTGDTGTLRMMDAAEKSSAT